MFTWCRFGALQKQVFVSGTRSFEIKPCHTLGWVIGSHIKQLWNMLPELNIWMYLHKKPSLKYEVKLIGKYLHVIIQLIFKDTIFWFHLFTIPIALANHLAEMTNLHEYSLDFQPISNSTLRSIQSTIWKLGLSFTCSFAWTCPRLRLLYLNSENPRHHERSQRFSVTLPNTYLESLALYICILLHYYKLYFFTYNYSPVPLYCNGKEA